MSQVTGPTSRSTTAGFGNINAKANIQIGDTLLTFTLFHLKLFGTLSILSHEEL